MSRRMGTAIRTAERNTISMWMLACGIALIGMLIWMPITASADTSYNGWILIDASVVSAQDGMIAEIDLDEQTLQASWQEEHSRGLSSYTWDYEVNLTWSAPPAVLAAGQSAPISWTIENVNANPLLTEENLAWAIYAPELRWAGLGDADTLPCDHSPTYIAFDESAASRTCDAVTRAPESDADRMAIILETGIYQNGAWHNVMIQYTYSPATLDAGYVDAVTETTPISNSLDRYIKSPATTIHVSGDCGIGAWSIEA